MPRPAKTIHLGRVDLRGDDEPFTDMIDDATTVLGVIEDEITGGEYEITLVLTAVES